MTFYKNMIDNASQRIILGSLYLGTGDLEHKLVDGIRRRVESVENLRVGILLDHLRGNRLNASDKDNASSSAHLLLNTFSTLSQTIQKRLGFFFYHTPELAGVWKSLVPQRYNEIAGVSHLKFYLCDDTLIISGANLSDSYFTNRQDRYIKIRNCKALGDYYEDLFHTISKYSFRLKFSEESTAVQKSIGFDEPKLNPVRDPVGFKSAFELELLRFIARHSSSSRPEYSEEVENLDNHDTFIYPLIQAGNMCIRQEEEAMKNILALMSSSPTSEEQETTNKYRMRMATGYFNMTDIFEKLILETSGSVHLLCASENANGFKGARGPAGLIPSAYSETLRSFLNKIIAAKKQDFVHVWEYDRPGWTFHAKGVWLYENDSLHPFLTTIGSPNYGHRSANRDLENELVIVTRNEDLQHRLHDEVQQLYRFSCGVDSSQTQVAKLQGPWWLRLFIPFIRSLL